MTRKAMFVCCSDTRPETDKTIIIEAARKLNAMGVETRFAGNVFSRCYTDACTRAYKLMEAFSDPEVTDIFDISGGDTANGILSYLDYEAIRNSRAVFWGYSDLTAVINAIYTLSRKQSFLYQIKNICGSFQERQTACLREYISGTNDTLIRPCCRFINGSSMSGTLIGGNVRCLLKLAGTRYMPEAEGAVLLLEAMGGKAERIRSYADQLLQMGILTEVSGIILGTFTEAEKNSLHSAAEEIFLDITKARVPIVRTPEIGHAPDSKAVIVGRKITVKQGPPHFHYQEDL